MAFDFLKSYHNEYVIHVHVNVVLIIGVLCQFQHLTGLIPAGSSLNCLSWVSNQCLPISLQVTDLGV